MVVVLGAAIVVNVVAEDVVVVEPTVVLVSKAFTSTATMIEKLKPIFICE